MNSLENRHTNRIQSINLGWFFSFLLFNLHINMCTTQPIFFLAHKGNSLLLFLFFFSFFFLEKVNYYWFLTKSKLRPYSSLFITKHIMEPQNWLTPVLENFEASNQYYQAFGSLGVRSYTSKLDTITFLNYHCLLCSYSEEYDHKVISSYYHC